MPAPVPLDLVCARLLPALLARRGDLLAIKHAGTGRYAYVNEAMIAFVNRAGEFVLGCTDAELFDGTIATSLRAAEQTALAQREPLLSEHSFEWRGQRWDFAVLRARVEADGCTWLCSIWSNLQTERRRDEQLRVALEQIEQQQSANQQLRRELADQALRDQASGLHSRGHFEEQLHRELDLSTREHREFAVVFIEVDPPLPEVTAPGAILQERLFEAVGRLLRSGTRAMDASCRWDERQFAVLLSGVGLATAHSRMESLRRQCATQIVMVEGREARFTVSMGVASFPHTAQGRDELLSSCEAALAEARRRGGNQVALASIRLEAG